MSKNNINISETTIKFVDLCTLDFDSTVKSLKILDQLSHISIEGNIYSIKERINKINEYLITCHNHRIFVIYFNLEIIGMISIIIEPKIIHDFRKVCHIEDFVIDKQYRGVGIGKIVLNKIKDLAKMYNCYKIILNCSDDVKNFYEKCGFKNTNSQMALYFNNV